MSGTRGWLKGCGIGCGGVVLLGVGACVAGTLYLQHTFRGVKTWAQSHDALVAGLGDIEDYVPPDDGALPPERLELFLEIRESLTGVRTTLEERVAEIPLEVLSRDASLQRKIMESLEALGDLIQGVGEYLEARNQALLEHRMGAGEYVYTYCVTYYSWLGHAPADVSIAGREGDGAFGGIFDEESSSHFNAKAVRRRYRRHLIGMTRRQLESVEKKSGAEAQSWTAELAAELRRLEERPGHVLWQEGLPTPIEESLLPFRDRLKASYSALTNRFELPLADHEAPWEWE
jgi:hypothetical protein